MKDQIDVAVRRSPKYSVFISSGAVLGVLVAGILALFVSPEDMPMGYSVSKGLGLLLVVLGASGLLLGGLVALILDWRGRKKARQYRVDAQIDMVDDPKEIARRRLAEARGEDPDADPEAAAADGAADSGTEANSGTEADGTHEAVSAEDADDAAAAGDATDTSGNARTERDSGPDSTV